MYDLKPERESESDALDRSARRAAKPSVRSVSRGAGAAEDALARLTETRMAAWSAELSNGEDADPAAEERRRLWSEILRLRRKTLELSAQNERLRNTVSFRLGGAILKLRSLEGWRRFPSVIRELVADSRNRRRDAKAVRVSTIELIGEYAGLERLLARAATDDPNVLVSEAFTSAPDLDTGARWLIEVAKAVRHADIARAVEIGRRAVETAPRDYRLAWLASLLYDAGMIEEPAKYIEWSRRLGGVAKGAQAVRQEVILGLERARRGAVTVPPRVTDVTPVNTRTALYVAASSMPHHVSGYTVRTQSILRAMQATGWTVAAATRPGYPWDRSDSRNVDGACAHYEVDGVTYRRLQGPPSNASAFDGYVESAAEALADLARETGAAVIHAASNHVNALPALIAARRLGLPFVYEVRGLWEYTSASKFDGWEGTERFRLTADLEGLVAREADAVLTLSRGLADELGARGVDRAKIDIAPNCTEPGQVGEVIRDDALVHEHGLGGRWVMGFIGSVVGYEGLDDLVTATASMAAQGRDVALVVVGDGAALDTVRERARDLGVLDRLVAPGRVPREAVGRWYGLLNAAVYPRRPERVSEIVPPLKPLEAMAAGVPVVASDVAAIAEMISHGENGLLFEKGSVRSLTAVLEQLMDQPKLAARLAERGRDFVVAERSWAVTAAKIVEVYERLVR